MVQHHDLVETVRCTGTGIRPTILRQWITNCDAAGFPRTGGHGRSSGGSPQFEKRLRNVLIRAFNHTFTDGDAFKDTGMYLGVAESAHYHTSLASVVHRQLERARAAGDGEEGPSAVAKLHEVAAGAEIAAEEPVHDVFLGHGTVREETG